MGVPILITIFDHIIERDPGCAVIPMKSIFLCVPKNLISLILSVFVIYPMNELSPSSYLSYNPRRIYGHIVSPKNQSLAGLSQVRSPIFIEMPETH